MDDHYSFAESEDISSETFIDTKKEVTTNMNTTEKASSYGVMSVIPRKQDMIREIC